MSIELMFNAANLALVAFSRAWVNNAGHVFVFLVITVAAAEAAIGLAIVVAVFRRSTYVDVDEIASLMPRMNALLISVWLLPLAGALLLWAFGPQLNRAAGVVGTFVVFFAFALTVALFDAGRAPDGLHLTLGSWVPGFDFGLLLDPLSLLWALVITGIGGLIHAYAVGYMASDKAVARFFAYMNFFVFAMLTLVLSDNFVGLLIGWGLVGLPRIS